VALVELVVGLPLTARVVIGSMADARGTAHVRIRQESGEAGGQREHSRGLH
jgi:hypothetical protein